MNGALSVIAWYDSVTGNLEFGRGLMLGVGGSSMGESAQ